MTEPIASLTDVLLRALVVGIFGGAGLILMHMYTRRGPLLYIVYAAVLLCTALMLSQYEALPFTARFSAVLIALTVASLLLYVRVARRSVRAARRRALEGEAPLPAGKPWWGMPLVGGTLAAVSAGVAFLLR